MSRFLRWLHTPVPWDNFWDPRSGARGGAIMGAFLWAVFTLIHFLRQLL